MRLLTIKYNMKQNIKEVLAKQVTLIKPEKDILACIKRTSEKLCADLRKKLKNKKIKADVFIGEAWLKARLLKRKIMMLMFLSGLIKNMKIVRFQGSWENA